MDWEWSSNRLDPAHEEHGFGPLYELAAFAAEHTSLYALIFTEREFVVVRFFIIKRGHLEDMDTIGAQWKAVPYSEEVRDVLTSNMAFWGLVMIAVVPEMREIRLEEGTFKEKPAYIRLTEEPLPLNTWQPLQEKGQGRIVV